MTRKVLKRLGSRFIEDRSGAVTVDWVVLTAAIVGIGVTVAIPAINASTALSGNTGYRVQAAGAELLGLEVVADASSYFDRGIATYPNSQNDAWREARAAVAADAPAGYNYDPNFHGTRYVDMASGHPIYESDDGQTYMINGEVVQVADYDVSNRQTFRDTFNDRWNTSS